MKRRNFIRLGAAAPFVSAPFFGDKPDKIHSTKSKSEIKHSICRWCYQSTPLEELCEKAKDRGVQSIELLHAFELDTVYSYGMQCAVMYANDWGLTRGFNRINDHEQLLHDYRKAIEIAHDKGVPQIICFSGNANGLDSEQGIENCAVGLDPVLKLAEKYDVIICMELLNSSIDHPDYQCDKTGWGVRLLEKMGSSHFKLLYDIYHMQVMEGNIIHTIRQNKDYISHFHTGGVPGRNEIDETQELNYGAIMRAIQANGFKGFVAQEYIPTWDKPFDALEKAINICTV